MTPEEEQALRKIGASDQLQASLRDFATMAGSFYRQLLDEGIPRRLAGQMTIALVVRLFGMSQ